MRCELVITVVWLSGHVSLHVLKDKLLILYRAILYGLILYKVYGFLEGSWLVVLYVFELCQLLPPFQCRKTFLF